MGIDLKIVEDEIDYGGQDEDIGKNKGEDLREGKIKIKVIIRYRSGKEEERDLWKGDIEGGEREED